MCFSLEVNFGLNVLNNPVGAAPEFNAIFYPHGQGACGAFPQFAVAHRAAEVGGTGGAHMKLGIGDLVYGLKARRRKVL